MLVQHHDATGRWWAWCEKAQAPRYSPAPLKTSASCSLTEMQSLSIFSLAWLSFRFILFYRTFWSNNHHGCNIALRICAERCHARKPAQLSRNWHLNEHLQLKSLGPGNRTSSSLCPAVGHSTKDPFSWEGRGKVAGWKQKEVASTRRSQTPSWIQNLLQVPGWCPHS